MSDPLAAVLRDRVPYILFGTVFLFIGLGACGMAAMRRSGLKLLGWLGIWSAIEGSRYLFSSLADLNLLPQWFRVSFQFLDNILGYLVVVVAVMAFLQLSRGKLRLFLQGALVAALTIAVAGVGFFLFAGSPYKLMVWNQLLVACSLAVLGVVVAVPELSRSFLILPNRIVLSTGIFLFSLEAVYGNLSLPLGLPSPPEILDPLGFALLLFCFGYAAAERLETSSMPVDGLLVKH
jgi:hypothetical protein